jgi:O-antigen/teichoic acid export membrane protein
VLNSSKIALGTILAQLISLLTTPLLTRFLGPTVYGEFGTFTAIYGLIGGIVFLGLSSSIIISEDHFEAENLYNFCYKLLIIFTLVFTFILLALSPIYNPLTSSNDYYIVIVLLSTTLFSSNFLSLNVVWLNRLKNYNLIFLIPILTISINMLAAFALIYFRINNLSLIIGTILGQLFSSFFIVTLIKPPIQIHRKIEPKKLLIKYKDFPKYQLPSNLIKGVGSNLPILLMTAFYGSIFVGFFAMSQRLLYIPVSLIGAAVGQVHYKKCAELNASKVDIGEFSYETMKLILFIVFIPFLLLNIFGEQLSLIFLGREWGFSGVIISIRSFEFILTTIYFSISYIYIVLRKQMMSLILSIATLFTNTTLVIVAYYLGLSDVHLVLYLSITNILLYFIFFIAAFKYTTFGISRVLKLLVLSSIVFIVISQILEVIL